jgi:hypothetical protein
MGLNRNLIIILLLFSSKSFGQNAQEIFSQKKTAIQYLTQQIAALQLYMGYAQKGYSIAKDGLNFIADLKKGDINLHGTYFNSLKEIKPDVQQYAKVTEIILGNVKIIKYCKNTYRRIRQSGQFNDNEINYIHSVFQKVTDDADGIIDQLTTLITADGFQMKDDERLRRIDMLHQRMQDNQSFVQHFSNGNYVLSGLRKKDKQELEISRSLNNLK